MMAFKVPSMWRVTSGHMASTNEEGNNGVFRIKHPFIDNYIINVIASDGMGWEHVSVSLICVRKNVKMVERCPTWKEMCYVKDIFWDGEDAVMQLHPPVSMHVSTHPYCLHLWRPVGQAIPLPPPIMVGIPGTNIQSF